MRTGQTKLLRLRRVHRRQVRIESFLSIPSLSLWSSSLPVTGLRETKPFSQSVSELAPQFSPLFCDVEFFRAKAGDQLVDQSFPLPRIVVPCPGQASFAASALWQYRLWYRFSETLKVSVLLMGAWFLNSFMSSFFIFWSKWSNERLPLVHLKKSNSKVVER